jgi:hypothetical protein
MKKLISEDNTMFNVQRQQSGSTARQDSKGETAPQPNQVKNLFNANKRDDNSLAPTLKPYPLHLTDEVLSDMFISTTNLRKILEHAVNNPALKRKNLENIRYVNRRVELINRAIVDISRELDKIG